MVAAEDRDLLRLQKALKTLNLEAKSTQRTSRLESHLPSILSCTLGDHDNSNALHSCYSTPCGHKKHRKTRFLREGCAVSRYSAEP